jgi:hypothetical protein
MVVGLVSEDHLRLVETAAAGVLGKALEEPLGKAAASHHRDEKGMMRCCIAAHIPGGVFVHTEVKDQAQCEPLQECWVRLDDSVQKVK